MRRLANFLNADGINLKRTLVNVSHCRNCGRALNVYKMRMIGGPRKGSWTTITEPCDCSFSQQALQEADRIKRERFYELSTINDALKQATLKNFSAQNASQIHAVEHAVEFVEKIGENKPARMFYYGKPGLGKSHLAVGISKLLDQKYHKTCLFIDVPALKLIFKSTWTKESTLTERDLMTFIADADLLILDDVGAEGITPWSKELMFAILNARLSKSLLVTTNRSISELDLDYGPKIIDRFLENMSKADLVHLDGDYSHRLARFIEDDEQ
ncbi:ATP-binding protein [Sporolactobacillus terrae]|jgi:DNA replication protein DnaC|uniref:ATP-binding protein n=1 Tax=Sporolactobacillus terrae TaxID=269673 RepID=A0ABX5QA39_9BACL|nr:ATP-binding protein [Sporolactobacillus terrae]QAA23498.1 ATP-binding protein [Sporolactobacillus terrae]QAA26468.1 ATP-binding protein [Sporolactobacillus terrae]UAK15558.1 ATP-binding protein [Sporolactobacillus terrae]